MKKTVFLVTSQIKNFIQTYNNQLKNAYKNISDEDTENSYLVLLYEDLAANLKDKDKFIDDYIAFAEEFNLPYTFFPYYSSFNKALIKCSNGIPHPIFDTTIESKDNMRVHIIHQIAPGCLILNVNKLKSIDFKFDQNYPTMFFLQDFAEKCYRAKLWISNCWYLDRFESWKDLKTINYECKFNINIKNFQGEQKKYFETFKDCKFKDAQAFIDDIKKWLKGEDIPVETNQVMTVQNSDVNISVSNDVTSSNPSIEVKKEEKIDPVKIIKSLENSNNKPQDINIGVSQNTQRLAQFANMIKNEEAKVE